MKHPDFTTFTVQYIHLLDNICLISPFLLYIPTIFFA